MRSLLVPATVLLAAALATSCRREASESHDHAKASATPAATSAPAATPAPKADADEHHHHHHHEAPHGGTLAAIGDHFAHLELVLDAATGRLTAYVLDGEASGPVRVAQESIELTLTMKDPAAKEPLRVVLTPVADTLTGESKGDTSVFAATIEGLKGAKAFDVVAGPLSIKGQAIDKLSFPFPEGTECSGDHDH